LHLLIDIAPDSLPHVDEVRVRVGRLGPPGSADLGASELAPIREAGAQILPGAGETTLSFARGSFPLSTHFEVRLVPNDPADVNVRLGGGLFAGGAWLGGSNASENTVLSGTQHSDANLSLACDGLGCPPVDVIDLAAPPASPAVVLARASIFGPLRLLAVGPVGQGVNPQGAALIAADDGDVLIFRPIRLAGGGMRWPDAIAPSLVVHLKLGEAPVEAAAVGDIDGDGVTDLALGAPLARSAAGLVMVLPGTSLQGTGEVDLGSPTASVQRIHGESSEALGSSLAVVPGTGALAVGAPQAGGTGRAYLITPQPGEISSTTATAMVNGRSGTHLGRVLAVDDLDNGSTLVLGAPEEGTVYLVRVARLTTGTVIDLATTNAANARLIGPGDFGASLATGSLRNPHTLTVGAPGGDRVFAFEGGAIESWSAPAWTFVGATGSQFGASVALGHPAALSGLLVGAPAASPLGRSSGGTIHFFRGDRLGDAGVVPSFGLTEAAFVAWGANDLDGAGARVLCGNFDASDQFDTMLLATTGAPGAVYGIKGLPSP
jgi:hypothetical protein